jgi:hypothetical protein
MDVMLHLTRLNARKDESGEEKESAGLKALAGCDRFGQIYESAANAVQHTLSNDTVTANDVGIPIFRR